MMSAALTARSGDHGPGHGGFGLCDDGGGGDEYHNDGGDPHGISNTDNLFFVRSQLA